MTATMTEPTKGATTALAQEVNRALRTYLASAADRVFESGTLLGRIQDEGLFRALAHDSFESFLAVLQEEGVIARSTAYSNMKIARIFDRSKHAYIGIGRLRKLVDVPGAVTIIEEGFDVPDGAGGTVRKRVTDFKCRGLEKALKAYKSPESQAADAPATAGPPINEVYEAILALAPRNAAPTGELAAGRATDPNDRPGLPAQLPELGEVGPDQNLSPATDAFPATTSLGGEDVSKVKVAARTEGGPRPAFKGPPLFGGDEVGPVRTPPSAKRRGTPPSVA